MAGWGLKSGSITEW